MTRRPTTRPAVVAVLGAVSTLAAPLGVRAQEAFEPVTPYRPSVSSPAQLPAVGQLEAEVGLLNQRSADQRRTSVPYLLKFAWSEQWGLLLGGEARVWQRDSSGRTEGVGDTVLILKRAWAVAEGTGLGVELGVKLPTAREAIGTGRADQSINGIWSQDVGPVHVDANLNATRIGRIDDGESRMQTGASVAVSGAIGGGWGLTGELSGTRRSGAPSGHQVLGAVTYGPSKFATFDIGVSRAARPGPGVTSVFLGAVFPVARGW